MLDRLKTYYYLAKPGIIYGNDLTAVGGFLLASQGHLHIGLFVAMLVGISLVMASGCVFNNYVDRGIDKKMARTKKRALVQGTISSASALTYASVLGLAGLGLLAGFVNMLAAAVGFIGLFVYVVLYGISKRRSVHGTLVGSIAGAVPPVVGYVAVTGTMDLGAWLLFLIMACWQMPHFYAIAVYRLKDYAAAGLPVLPVQKGMVATKTYMLFYVVAYMVAITLLTMFGYTGLTYLIVMLAVSLWWLRTVLRSSKTTNEEQWARGVFGFSLVVLLTFSFMISVDWLLP